MRAKIQLPSDAYECLKRHISQTQAVYSSLENAKELIGFKNGPLVQFILECDEKDAAALLKAAQQYCGHAVGIIEEAIKTSLGSAAGLASFISSPIDPDHEISRS